MVTIALNYTVFELGFGTDRQITASLYTPHTVGLESKKHVAISKATMSTATAHQVHCRMIMSVYTYNNKNMFNGSLSGTTQVSWCQKKLD